MQINSVEKKEDGSASIVADLTQEQLEFVVSLGLNVLHRAGAVKIQEQQSKAESSLVITK